VEAVPLGATGLRVSRLGLGCWAFGGHGWGEVRDEDSVRAVRRALDLGVNFFDTADAYGLGHSEEVLAAALGPRRKEAVIATKFGVRVEGGRSFKDLSPAHLRRALEGSLRRLRLDCVPLYYAHWPDGRTPVADVLAELARCRAEGKVRGVGLSNFSAEQVRQALEVGPVDALQFELSLLERRRYEELLPAVGGRPVTLVTWGSLARGLLTGKFHAASTFAATDTRGRDRHFQAAAYEQNLRAADALRPVAERNGVSRAQLALRWVLDAPGVGVALFGAKTPEQVADNCGALGWPLSAADAAELSRAAAGGP
jgi:aryl-alcohol dehydrogenase-like predicted oxidoreductase